MQDESGWGTYGDSQGIGNRVVHSDELALELADADLVTVGDDALRNVPQTVLTQLLGQQRQCQFGPDEWDVGSLSQQVRHSADVILVTVSEHQAASRRPAAR